MEQVNFWQLLAGLGIFLFGTFLMEEAIKNLSGRAFKKLIHQYTNGRLRSVLAGTFVTAILQSSTAVSFMVLAFAGAGIMSMSSAIGVILGSNIGTTLTSWIVATFGFKMNIEALALPFVGIGGVGLFIFGKTSKGLNISKALIGFGFLFLGLNYMKESIESLTKVIDIHSLSGYSLPVFLFAGFVLTAIIQSSTASMAIILSAVHSGLLSFPSAAAMVIGSNIGTTITVLIGTIGASTIKKRVAYSHFFFNIITALIIFSLFPVILYLLNDFFKVTKDPVIGLAIFHTLFNVSGVIIFFPFIGFFATFISWIVKEKKSAITLYLNKLSPEMPDVPEAVITSLKKETLYLLQLVLFHNLLVFNIPKKIIKVDDGSENGLNPVLKLSIDKIYIHIKLLQAEIFSYVSRALSAKLYVTEVKDLNRVLNAARYAVVCSKSIKDIRPDIEELYNSDNEFLFGSYNNFSHKIEENYKILAEVLQENKTEISMSMLIKLREKINNDDADFIAKLTDAIGKQQVTDINISNLLAANRGTTISTRQAVLSLRDLLFTEEQAAIFENLEDSGELIYHLNKNNNNNNLEADTKVKNNQ